MNYAAKTLELQTAMASLHDAHAALVRSSVGDPLHWNLTRMERQERMKALTLKVLIHAARAAFLNALGSPKLARAAIEAAEELMRKAK